MKKFSIMLMLFALIAGSLMFVACSDDDDDTESVNYFPIAIGNMWNFDYAVTYDDTGDTLISGEYSQEFVRTRNIEGLDYYVLQDSPDTNTVLYYREGDDYVWGGMDQTVLASVVTILFKAVPNDVSVGDTWQETYEITIGLTATVYGECRSKEAMTVPSGSYDDCLHINLRFETSVPSIPADSINFWIAPEVGPVKYISYQPDDEPGTTKTSFLNNVTLVD